MVYENLRKEIAIELNVDRVILVRHLEKLERQKLDKNMPHTEHQESHCP